MPLSIFLIFLLLFNAFGSVKSALLILSNIPFALVGGILALLITKIPLSVSAAIGFIALFGQAVLNGVVIVSYFNAAAQGMYARQAAIEGSLVRFRTVLMTALLAMLGLLPMALSKGIGSEVQKPLAVVIIGGLVSATALTLVCFRRSTRWWNEGEPCSAGLLACPYRPVRRASGLPALNAEATLSQQPFRELVLPVNVRQPHVAALIAICQLGMIDTDERRSASHSHRGWSVGRSTATQTEIVG